MLLGGGKGRDFHSSSSSSIFQSPPPSRRRFGTYPPPRRRGTKATIAAAALCVKINSLADDDCFGGEGQRRVVGEEGEVLKEPQEEEEMQVSKMSKEEADFKPSTPFCGSSSEPPQFFLPWPRFFTRPRSIHFCTNSHNRKEREGRGGKTVKVPPNLRE